MALRRHPHVGERARRGDEDDLRRGSRVGNFGDDEFGAWHHVHVAGDGEHKLVCAQ